MTLVTTTTTEISTITETPSAVMRAVLAFIMTTFVDLNTTALNLPPSVRVDANGSINIEESVSKGVNASLHNLSILHKIIAYKTYKDFLYCAAVFSVLLLLLIITIAHCFLLLSACFVQQDPLLEVTVLLAVSDILALNFLEEGNYSEPEFSE